MMLQSNWEGQNKVALLIYVCIIFIFFYEIHVFKYQS